MTESCSKKNVERKPKFLCKNCDYNTSKMSSWKKHIKTKKHKKSFLYKNETKNRECLFCGEIFFSRTTLWRHKKKCEKFINYNKKQQLLYNCFTKKKAEKAKKNGVFGDFSQKNKNNTESENTILTPEHHETKTQISELKNMVKNLIQTQTKLQENIKDYIDNPRTVNNNCNNSMTINMYLNNDCKDAMNLKDFVDNVTISWDDLDYTKANGYVNGISNIFAKQLKDLKPTERPIHCSDTKKLQFYFKDENKWEKDIQNNKMDESIKIITKKQMIQIKEWELAHPTYTEDNTLLEEWHNMILCIMGGKNEKEIKTNKEKIKKNIGNTVKLDHLINKKININ